MYFAMYRANLERLHTYVRTYIHMYVYRRGDLYKETLSDGIFQSALPQLVQIKQMWKRKLKENIEKHL